MTQPPLAAPESGRATLRTGYPNPLDGVSVVVMGRRNDRLRLGVTDSLGDRPLGEFGVGDLLILTRTWRVVSIEPRETESKEVPGAGSGRVAAVLELVTE